MSSTIKKIKIFSSIPLPEQIVAPLLTQSDKFDFKSCTSLFAEKKDILLEFKNCDALILSALIQIDKDVLDLIGPNLKVQL